MADADHSPGPGPDGAGAQGPDGLSGSLGSHGESSVKSLLSDSPEPLPTPARPLGFQASVVSVEKQSSVVMAFADALSTTSEEEEEGGEHIAPLPEPEPDPDSSKVFRQRRGSVVVLSSGKQTSVTIGTQVDATVQRLKHANMSGDVNEMQAAIQATQALSVLVGDNDDAWQAKELAEKLALRLLNDPILSGTVKLRRSTGVRDKVMQLWDLMKIETKMSAEARGAGRQDEEWPEANKSVDEVSRGAFQHMLIRLQKVLCPSSRFRLGRAREKAFEDWKVDIGRFSSSSHVTLMLDNIRQKFLKVIDAKLNAIGLEQVFVLLDEDGSGDIDADEFIEAVREDLHVPEEVCTDHDLLSVFNAIDVDGGGEISQYEFVEWMTAHTARVSRIRVESPRHLDTVLEVRRKILEVSKDKIEVAGWKSIFDKYDDDKSGNLDSSKFKIAVRSECNLSEHEVSDELLDELFVSIDADSSGAINAAELYDGMTTEMQVGGMTFSVFFSSLFQLMQLWIVEPSIGSFSLFIDAVFKQISELVTDNPHPFSSPKVVAQDGDEETADGTVKVPADAEQEADGTNGPEAASKSADDAGDTLADDVATSAEGATDEEQPVVGAPSDTSEVPPDTAAPEVAEDEPFFRFLPVLGTPSLVGDDGFLMIDGLKSHNAADVAPGWDESEGEEEQEQEQEEPPQEAESEEKEEEEVAVPEENNDDEEERLRTEAEEAEARRLAEEEAARLAAEAEAERLRRLAAEEEERRRQEAARLALLAEEERLRSEALRLQQLKDERRQLEEEEARRRALLEASKMKVAMLNADGEEATRQAQADRRDAEAEAKYRLLGIIRREQESKSRERLYNLKERAKEAWSGQEYKAVIELLDQALELQWGNLELLGLRDRAMRMLTVQPATPLTQEPQPLRQPEPYTGSRKFYQSMTRSEVTRLSLAGDAEPQSSGSRAESRGGAMVTRLFASGPGSWLPRQRHLGLRESESSYQTPVQPLSPRGNYSGHPHIPQATDAERAAAESAGARRRAQLQLQHETVTAAYVRARKLDRSVTTKSTTTATYIGDPRGRNFSRHQPGPSTVATPPDFARSAAGSSHKLSTLRSPAAAPLSAQPEGVVPASFRSSQKIWNEPPRALQASGSVCTWFDAARNPALPLRPRRRGR